MALLADGNSIATNFRRYYNGSKILFGKHFIGIIG